MVTEKRAPASRAPREDIKEAPIVPPEPGTVYDVFQELFPHLELAATQSVADVVINVPQEAIHNVLKVARAEPRLSFDYLRSLCGVDEVGSRGGVDVVYHLFSFTHRHSVTLKTLVPDANPVIPTSTDIWIGADWHERETAEMFGLTFEGHPHPMPLLLEEGLDINPLRKDHPLAEVEIKQGTDVFAFKEEFNWGGAGIGEEVVSDAAGTTGTARDGAAATPAAPAKERRKLTPEEMEAAKERAAALRAEHQAKKASGQTGGDRKKRYTPEEIAAIRAKAGVTASAAPAPEAPAPQAAAPAEAAPDEAPAEAAETPAAAPERAPRRKLTPEEMEEVKQKAAALRAEHQEAKAAGKTSGERKKRYTPEEIEEIKRRAQGGQ
ncbi:MAG: hypothetical protein GEU28_00955 [Dehalococcoidia bacterium]|nr:hypothetical protein [Dehalococcoidia bacterium]